MPKIQVYDPFSYDNSPDDTWDIFPDNFSEVATTSTVGSIYGASGETVFLKATIAGKKYEATITGKNGYIGGVYDTWLTGTGASVDGQQVVSYTGIGYSFVKFLALPDGQSEETILSGNDQLIGAGKADSLWGYGGDDLIYGMGGNDYLVGGNGADTIYGGGGDDTIVDWTLNGHMDNNGNYLGGDGIDTLRLHTSSKQVMLSRDPISSTITIYSKGAWESFAYSDIEFIEFDDATISTVDVPYRGEDSFLRGSAGIKPVYEFYNQASNAYFYTADLSERNLILAKSIKSNTATQLVQQAEYWLKNIFKWGGGSEEIQTGTSEGSWSYFYQGSSFNAASVSTSKTTTIHRFYNVDTGHHLWSIDPNEIALIKSKWDSGEWSYKYEGTSFRVYSSDPNPSDPNIGENVYRLYNSEEGRHFYSADVEEVNQFQLTGVWQLEGVAFWGE